MAKNNTKNTFAQANSLRQQAEKLTQGLLAGSQSAKKLVSSIPEGHELLSRIQRALQLVTASGTGPLNEKFYRQIVDLSRVLKKREFFPVHFGVANKIIEEIKADPANIIERSESLDRDASKHVGTKELITRNLIQGLQYYQRRGAYHQPCSLQIMQSRVDEKDYSIFSYTETWYPLFIDLRKITTNQYVRAREKFDPTELYNLSTMALAFSKTLETMPEYERQLSSRDGMHLFLPGSGGIFACHAQKIPTSRPDANVCVLRSKQNGKYYVSDQPLFWQPQIRIFARTFFSDRLVAQGTGYDAVSWEFKKLMQEPELDDALQTLHARFMHPFAISVGSINFENVEVPEFSASIKDIGEEAEELKLDSEIMLNLANNMKRFDELIEHMEARLKIFMREHALRWASEKYKGDHIPLEVPDWNRPGMQLLFDAQRQDITEAHRRMAIRENTGKKRPDKQPAVEDLIEKEAKNPSSILDKIIGKMGEFPGLPPAVPIGPSFENVTPALSRATPGPVRFGDMFGKAGPKQ